MPERPGPTALSRTTVLAAVFGSFVKLLIITHIRSSLISGWLSHLLRRLSLLLSLLQLGLLLGQGCPSLNQNSSNQPTSGSRGFRELLSQVELPPEIGSGLQAPIQGFPGLLGAQ